MLFRSTLPFLSYLTPFTYGITEEGGLVVPDDVPLIRAAHAAGTAALMHLSTLTREGGFSNDLAHLVLNDEGVQDALVGNVSVPVYFGLIPSAAEIWKDRLPTGLIPWPSGARTAWLPGRSSGLRGCPLPHPPPIFPASPPPPLPSTSSTITTAALPPWWTEAHAGWAWNPPLWI